MNGWDVVSNIINQFPPVATTLLLCAAIAAMIIGIVGFSKHGLDFIRHGFSQNFLSEILSNLATKDDFNRLETRIEKMETEMGGMKTEIGSMKTEMGSMKTEIGSMKIEMGGMKTELATIKVNHFGHLKNFLTELTGILLDKGVFNNTDKARLDNQLRGM